jgi:hypothetical protein
MIALPSNTLGSVTSTPLLPTSNTPVGTDGRPLVLDEGHDDEVVVALRDEGFTCAKRQGVIDRIGWQEG